ncbi:MAG: S8 family serine peptidase [Cytophagales bacterium]|nr:S8 family serine peptidase [Cytophagales bacterium]
MKKLLILFSLIIANMALLAQNDYYWYKNQKVFLEKIPTKKYLTLEDIEDSIVLKQKLNIPDLKVHKFNNINVFSSIKAYKGNVKSEKKWAIVKSQNIGNVKLTTQKDIIYEVPLYYTSVGKEVGISHLFYVKLFKEDDVENLEELAQQNNVEILGNNKFMPLWFTLSCSKHSAGNALDMANLFYETGLFVASEPDLMVDLLTGCVNDPHFNNQWGLKNTGQNGGTVGADINACQAWQTTTGSNNIVVAVLDRGIELNHPDMPNMHPVSFDTESDTSPSQVLGRHGTACAGIIGASSDNNLGVAGIAQNCPLMSISNNLDLSVDVAQELAAGFNFAWQNGASVISNSWGHDAYTSTLLDDAIDNALTQGRNGLGCVVVFITQNGNNSSVTYPANSNPDILAVGALSPCEERKNPSSCDGENWGSNYGTELDIMAPGVLIPTTDRQGTNGYNTSSGTSGDYTQTFGGTSAACPHVAGVAALILSVNPCLTGQQVRDIIEQTAQKVGSYSYVTTTGRPNGTWNNEMGYGLVDAFKAVNEAAYLFLQNQTITSTVDFRAGIRIEAGSNVDPNQPTGPFIIAGGANVTMEAGEEIIFTGDVEITGELYAFISQPLTCASQCRMANNNSNNDTHNDPKNEFEDNNIKVKQKTDEYFLSFNYPNPFNDHTHIDYYIKKQSLISISVFNVCGKKVAALVNNNNHLKGKFTTTLDGSNLPSGIYYYMIMNGDEVVETRKMVKSE